MADKPLRPPRRGTRPTDDGTKSNPTRGRNRRASEHPPHQRDENPWRERTRGRSSVNKDIPRPATSRSEKPRGATMRATPPRAIWPTPREAERREIKYYGVNACLALWQQRPQDVIRIYIEEALLPRFGPMLRWAAKAKKAYHIVPREDLERITESTHHQGVCVLAVERPCAHFQGLRTLLETNPDPQMLMYLDGVENPHNFGAILRACAHFGVSYVLGDGTSMPNLSPSACRVAEGGAEHVSIVRLDKPLQQLQSLKSLGFELTAGSVGRGRDLFRHHYRPRTVLILGAEETGVSKPIARLADSILTIPGMPVVESLNVSAACAVFAAEYFRQSAEFRG